jgi:hypothetical protein
MIAGASKPSGKQPYTARQRESEKGVGRELEIFAADHRQAVAQSPNNKKQPEVWNAPENGTSRRVSVKIGYSDQPIMEEVDPNGRRFEYK